MTTIQHPVPQTPPCGGHLVSADGRTLPLRSTRLLASTAGGIATVRVAMTFANPFAEVLQVRFQLPLPDDAAVAGFAFTLGDRRIQGRIDARAAARAAFERALVEGRTAGLLEQERASLFTQELGNLPPGAEVIAEVDVDQPLAWVDGHWEWRFPTTVAPRYLGADGRVTDAARLDVPIADGALPPRLEVELAIADALVHGGAPRSTSHTLQTVHADATTVRIAGAAMDRDVVVRWPVASPQVGLGLRAARPAATAANAHEAYGLLTLVPPGAGAGDALAKQPRDLIVLLDISGSMSGQPLAAAQRVTSELIASLDAGDRLELIAFSSRATPWLGAPCLATEGNKAAALRWLLGLRASGGTEMRDAILAALQPLRGDAQRQVVLVTDGLIGFEAEIVAAIRDGLPAGSRVHVVGVGSAPNRSLTRGASRAGRGLEVLVGLQDDAGPAARRLLERTAAPLVTGLQLGGSALLGVCPVATPDLFAGAPARLGLRLRAEGGTLTVRGATAAGPFAHDVVIAPVAAGTGDAFVPRLVGREWVEDLETAIAGNGDAAQLTAQIERIGLAFGIATRATSWVAVDEHAAVDPRAPQRVVDVPHELPHGMAVAGLGLRATAGAPMAAGGAMPACAPLGMAEQAEQAAPPPPPRSRKGGFGAVGGLGDLLSRSQAPKPVSPGASAKDEAAKKRKTDDAPPAPPAEPAQAAPRDVGARAVLRLRDGSELVFELAGLAAWTLPARVALRFADGSEHVLEVVAERSTRSGAVAAGAAVRLVLRGTAALPGDRPVALRLGTGADAVEVPIA